MHRRIIGIAISVVLAALGTFVLVAWVKGAEDRALAGERTVAVLVARQPIAAGAKAESLTPLVKAEKVPAKVKAEGAVEDLADLKGRVVAVDLLPGEQLVQGRFADPQEFRASGGVDLPAGLQAVTVALEPQRAVGGEIHAGDTVGVLASFDPFDVNGAITPDGEEVPDTKTPITTHMILHKVLVTNVQSSGAATSPTPERGANPGTDSGPGTAPTGDLLVTLALDSPAVERVVFAAEHGRLWLSAEPETATEDGTTIQTRGTVYE